MEKANNLIIVGASARAAAYSALRAGFRPWCIDQFADADLRAQCLVTAIPPDRYPRDIRKIMRSAPPGPWMYGGGLENRPKLVAALARERPLWGNRPSVLRAVRDPVHLDQVFQRCNIDRPDLRTDPRDLPTGRRWLVKRRDGAGGSSIQFWRPGHMQPHRRVFFQEYLDGPSPSAVYVGFQNQAQLLGVSLQLIGKEWLHAKPFQYCGSIWSADMLEPRTGHIVQQVGDALARECGVRGLFGVDYVVRDGIPIPVEVNPRYTASVEIVEFATGVSAIALHACAYDSFTEFVVPERVHGPASVGKAVLFARRSFTFPHEGPWSDMLLRPSTVHTLPPFTDIPCAGQQIEAGWPVLTFFAAAATPRECERQLQHIAADLDRCLHQR